MATSNKQQTEPGQSQMWINKEGEFFFPEKFKKKTETFSVAGQPALEEKFKLRQGTLAGQKWIFIG